MTMKWRPVVGYEGRYEVSDGGEVLSLLTNKILRSWGSKTDWRSRHLRVALHAGGGEGQKTFPVHKLVADAFLPPKPSASSEIRHKDGEHLNNRAENLEWATKSVNAYDQVRDGVHNNARKTHCKNNHEFTPENTMSRNGGSARRCRICMKQWRADWRKRQRKGGA